MTHVIDQQTCNTIKGLIIDGVNKAQSGHPGGAMSSTDLLYVLFRNHLRFDPHDPKWLGRDRFVLSAGHESMLLYSLLHMIGWLTVDDLMKFRQLHSRTPGHPENFLTPGVECTTGPLGQGAGMSVGFAIAGAHLAAELDPDLFASKTYSLLGDGCMQEDITLAAASMAGHLELSNLVWIYDRNRAQISGAIDRVTSDDEAKIFSGFGWEVTTIDGHDHRQIAESYAKRTTKPHLIIANTIMAKGTASMEGNHETHGAPLCDAEWKATKTKLGLNPDQSFVVTEEIKSHFQATFAEKKEYARKWNSTLLSRKQDPEYASKVNKRFDPVPVQQLSQVDFGKGPMATRSSFGKIIAAWANEIPSLIGGSADLEPSNMTGEFAKKVGDFSASNRRGRNLAFGVREFPMSAISNGLALYGGFTPFDATFLSFSDYSRPALRLGAIQKVTVIHEFTHDSFYLGEDGPTHQPVEHLMSLRAMPNMSVVRPADSLETEVCMRKVLGRRDRPACFALSRQALPHLARTPEQVSLIGRGAYILHAGGENVDTIIFATGSEVSLALGVADLIGKDKVRVVSVPCWEWFFETNEQYRDEVLGWHIPNRISIEAGCSLGWERFAGNVGLMIAMDDYGHSAPAGQLAKLYGFTPESIAAKIRTHFSNQETR